MISLKFKNKGFSLLELILVLGLSSLVFIGYLNYDKRRNENLVAESVGQQFEEIGKALSAYISKENSNLTANIAPGTTANMPLAVLQGVNNGFFVGRQYLPTTYNPQNAFKTNYIIQIRNNGLNLTGLVISDVPITDETGQVRYDWIGYALRKSGSQAGGSFLTNTSITGLNGGWGLTNVEFNAINAAGQLAYRSQYQNNYDGLYLRLDGTYPMAGNLNMGNYNINNATDINYTGWLNGNNALLNNLQVGYIHNTGNTLNDGDIQTASINGIGSPAVAPATNYANFERLYANVSLETPQINKDSNADVLIGNFAGGNVGSNLTVKDIYLTTGQSGRIINSWLSDRLPKYSSRGIYLVNDGTIVTKVNCGATPGIPKIEVIPQNQYVQGRVEGQIYPQNTLIAGNNNLAIYQDQYSIGAFAAYAIDNGLTWTVKIQTPVYDPAYTAGTALAHVYCDYLS